MRNERRKQWRAFQNRVQLARANDALTPDSSVPDMCKNYISVDFESGFVSQAEVKVAYVHVNARASVSPATKRIWRANLPASLYLLNSRLSTPCPHPDDFVGIRASLVLSRFPGPVQCLLRFPGARARVDSRGLDAHTAAIDELLDGRAQVGVPDVAVLGRVELAREPLLRTEVDIGEVYS